MRRFFCFNFLGDFYQAVLLFSLRELDFPVNHVGSRKLSVFVADDFVVDFEARLFNQPPGFALAFHKADLQKCLNHAQAGGVGNRNARQVIASASPRQILVASKARIFLASLISLSSKASRRRISSIGRSV